MSFRVTAVLDGDTFSVSPNWKWNNETGNTVRPAGYNTPEEDEPGHQEATEKLEGLIMGKDVELKNAIKITYGRLLCEVYVNGNNLAEYFPEYQ